MVLKPTSAKIVDFETSFDATVVPSPEGEMIWAEVRIDYILSGLSPSVIIRVPVPWSETEAPDQRKAKALRCARELIDHACRAAGVLPPESKSDSDTIGDRIEAVTPQPLEGVAQELGMARPTTRPKQKWPTR